MTRVEAEEEAWLKQARRALAPSAGDRARVRVGLMSAIAAAPLLDPGMAPEAPSKAPADAAPTRKLVATSLANGSQLLAFALVGVVTAGAGYWAGYRAASQRRPEPTNEPQLRAARTTSAVAAPSPAQAGPAAASKALEQQHDTPARAASAPPRRAEILTQPNAQGPRAEALPEVALDEELRTLRRAEHAQREGNPRLALVLLEELSQNARGGKLLEEREAVAVVARCALEPDKAAELGSAFERAHADSVYLERVKQSCGRGAK